MAAMGPAPGEGQGKRQRGQHRGAGDGTTGLRGHSGDLSRFHTGHHHGSIVIGVNLMNIV